MLPSAGRVLGIDVGFSATRPSTGMCLLWWNDQQIDWACRNVRSDPEARCRVLADLLARSPGPVSAVGIDGPLRPGLRQRKAYRAAEAVLSRGVFQRRGKPGSSGSPVGYHLHVAATELAHLARAAVPMGGLVPAPQVDGAPVVEAFPNQFLGVLHPEQGYPRGVRRVWTDVLYPRVRVILGVLVDELVPGREIRGTWDLCGHDEIAGLVCALTALCAASGELVAVGDEADGWIVLPPLRLWGAGADGAPWAWEALGAYLPAVQRRFPGARIRTSGC